MHAWWVPPPLMGQLPTLPNGWAGTASLPPPSSGMYCHSIEPFNLEKRQGLYRPRPLTNSNNSYNNVNDDNGVMLTTLKLMIMMIM